MLSISCIFKIRENYLIILMKIMRRKQSSTINQCFSCKNKIKESYAKVTTHYWIICLYTINACFYVFITNKLFNIFRNMLNTKAIKINNFIFLQNKAIQCAPVSACSARFITYAPSFISLGKLSRESTPLNLDSLS